MSIRRLEVLQWFGFVAGGTIWFASFLAGLGAATAVCNPGSSRWGIPHDTVQLVLAGVALVFLAAAEAAAVAVFRATRGAEIQGAPPHGRMRFFAVGAMAGNAVFAIIIVLATIATIADPTCHA
jgi:energy-converting hydrogenase Eha subunit E